MVNDDIKYKQILDRRGPGAQALLNLLQAVCLWVAARASLNRIFHDSA
jgi:hypothetical protein